MEERHEERQYDLIFICMPATPEEEISKIIATLEQTVAEQGGKVDKVEKWGTRKMAYRVAKQREGFYVLMELHSAKGELIKELERRLKVSDIVIKYMTVRLDEEIKRKGKLVERRERRVRRRPRKPAPGAPVPAVAAAAPVASAAPAPAAPAAHAPVEQSTPTAS